MPQSTATPAAEPSHRLEADRMPTLRNRWIFLSAAVLLGLATACADAPTAAPAASVAPSLAKGGANGSGSSSFIVSQRRVADTTVTVFVVGTNSEAKASFDIGHTSRIDFPYAASSICDPHRSNYGPGTWDQRCTAATEPVRITAKSWLNARGKLSTDFQPALRFVPGLRKSVTLYLKDSQLAPSTRILFCSVRGCVDEAAHDPSLQTQLDGNNDHAYRVIKHFSGYTVTAD